MTPIPRIEDLLRNAGFVRSLAGALVADPATADDVVQDAWVAALERPPRRAGAAWLRAVVRNLTANRFRSRGRRRKREAAVARPEAVRVEPGRAAMLMQVTEAVLRLDEPYRTAVLLRYYEGLRRRRSAGGGAFRRRP